VDDLVRALDAGRIDTETELTIVRRSGVVRMTLTPVARG
jgi:hypothetical protein